MTPTELPAQRVGPFTAARLVRWCAAQQNWDRIHYDADYARQHGGLADRVVNGALKQQLLARFLVDAFDASARLVRLDTRYAGPDLVDAALEVRGRVLRHEPVGARTAAHVALEIGDPAGDAATTTATAIVLLDTPAHADAPWADLPAAWRLDQAVEPADDAVPPAVQALLGHEIERRVSSCPLDRSRLRLFADAVTGLRPWQHDPRAAAAAGLETAVAPDLFPIHALEPEPGALPLSDDPAALGREGVAEVGRDLARRFGLSDRGAVNGGHQAEIHSLLRLGETACATSRLVAARAKAGGRGGAMLLATTLNDYATTTGRLLLRERQLVVFRHLDAAVPSP